MKKIKELKVALMEADHSVINDVSNDKSNYIIRSSAKLLLEDYLEKTNTLIEDEDSYLDFIHKSIGLMYNNLIDQSNSINYDTVGLWFKFEDDEMIDGSIDLATLKIIGEYREDLNPIEELSKITLVKSI